MFAVDAIKAAIDPRAEFTGEDMEEVSRLLNACCCTVDSPPAEYYREIKSSLESLTNGFGCWLDYIAAAIDRAEISETDRAVIQGAFGMAST